MEKDKVLIVGGGGNSTLALAAAIAASMPSVGGSVTLDLHERRRDYGPFTGWMKANGKLRPRAPERVRSVSRLQLRGWEKQPCDAPRGYLWHRAEAGRRLYYLLKQAPGPRHVEYDERFDRSIIRSGWGYVKPTYAPGDVR